MKIVENTHTVKYPAYSSVVCNSLGEHKMHEMTEEAFSEQWLIVEGFEDDSTMASENRASVDVEKDELRNALVNAFSPTKKVQEFYKSFI